MNYLYAILILIVFVLIFIISYLLNSKIEVECDNKNLCEGCNLKSTCYNSRKEN